MLSLFHRSSKPSVKEAATPSAQMEPTPIAPQIPASDDELKDRIAEKVARYRPISRTANFSDPRLYS